MAARKARNTTRQGANFELQIMHDLEAYGYVALRSSGSRGAVDVVGIGDGVVLLIQGKITNPVIPPKERRAVTRLADRVGPTAVPLVAYRVSGKVCYRVLTGTGPKDWMAWWPSMQRRAECSSPGCGHGFGWHAGEECWGTIQGNSTCPCTAFAAPGTTQGATDD